MRRIIKATLLAGLFPGLVVPVIWPVVVFLVEGKWPTWSVYPVAALSISFFAVIITLPSCIVLGSAALLGLERFALNTPSIAGVAGLSIAMLIYSLVVIGSNHPSVTESWPVAALFATIGTICGAMASSLSSTDKLLKSGAPQSGAP